MKRWNPRPRRRRRRRRQEPAGRVVASPPSGETHNTPHGGRPPSGAGRRSARIWLGRNM